MAATLRIGSRGSALAVAQAQWIGGRLRAHDPSLQIDHIKIVTTGDRDQNSSLTQIGGKGVFVKEIEEALLRNDIDVAVHSLKDVPQVLAPGLMLAPFPQREDSRDAVVSRFGELIGELPRGSTIGTSSPRRRAQISRRYSKRKYFLADFRGNLDTRLKKLHEGQVDAIVVALAGLKRLGLEAEATQILEPDEMLPAPGQGCLGLEVRIDDLKTLGLLAPLRHSPSDITARAERAFLQAIGGNCLIPLGAVVQITDETLHMRAAVYSGDGANMVEVKETGSLDQPELVGAKCAGRLIADGSGLL